MHNTIMRDKLENLLVAPSDPTLARRTNALIASALRARRIPQSQKSSILPTFRGSKSSRAVAEEPSVEIASTSRYVTPPKRKNPFRVHVYPSVDESVPESEPIVKEDTKLVTEEEEPQPTVEKEPEPVVEEKPTLVIEETKKQETSVVLEMPQPAEQPVPTAVEPAAPIEAKPVPSLEIVKTPAPAPDEKNEPESFQLQEKVPPAPAAALPPNLEWLEASTPFGDHLRPMVERLRAAKNEVKFTLEQSDDRQSVLRDQITGLKSRLDQEEFLAEQQREYLRQLDEVISACALVAEQSVNVETVLEKTISTVHKTHPPVNETTEKRAYRRFDEASTCHRDDVVKIFANSPGRKWDNKEIVNELPPAKRAHAKVYLYAVLSTLAKEGTIQRIAPGVYVNAQKA